MLLVNLIASDVWRVQRRTASLSAERMAVSLPDLLITHNYYKRVGNRGMLGDALPLHRHRLVDNEF